MNNEMNSNYVSMHQLKECYEMAALYLNDEIAKSVLREKAKAIDIPEGNFDIQGGSSCEKAGKNSLMNMFYELSLLGKNESTGNLYGKLAQAGPGSDLSEKELILAILSLRSGTGETNRIEALAHLKAAQTFTPGDPRITSMVRILEEQLV